MRSRGLVAGVLLVAAAVALVVAFTTGGSGNAEAAPSAALGTPLWSVRRVPEPVAEAVGTMRLQQTLDAAAPGTGTCFVVSAGDRTLASHNPDTPLTGASTQKILTAAAALSILGPDTTFDARVVASSAPTDGTVDRVWLVGGGDPVLSTNDYVLLPQVTAGVRATTSSPASRRWPTPSWPRGFGRSQAASSVTIPGTTRSGTAPPSRKRIARPARSAR